MYIKPQKGSLEYLNNVSKEYSDIIEICKKEEGIGEIIIYVKPNYNIDNVLEFCYKHIPLSIDYKIVQDYFIQLK